MFGLAIESTPSANGKSLSSRRFIAGRLLLSYWQMRLSGVIKPSVRVEKTGPGIGRAAKYRLVCVLAAALSGVAMAESIEPVDEIEVIGVTPLRGKGLDRQNIPANIQSATADELARRHALDLSQYMNSKFAGISINEAQSNPLQNDVQFRGFVASPLLGLPQGLAIFQDGVRLNEVFGDTVNWALVPQRAIATLDLVPGSNPVFGLNSLGGALSMKSKNGFDDPGAALEISGGSFDRLEIASEAGGLIADTLAYYVNGSYFTENGWRNFSPSDAARFFGSLGRRGDSSSIFATFTHAGTDLVGNGAAPVQLLEIDRASIFTHPDNTRNTLNMFNIFGDHALGHSLSMSWNAYYRQSDIDTLNGDDTDYEECENLPNVGFMCLDTAEGEDEVVARDENDSRIPANSTTDSATVNRSRTEQNGYGGSVQITMHKELGGTVSNQFLAGAGANVGEAGYSAGTELGFLDASRGAVSSGFLVQDAFTKLKTKTTTYSVYLMNTVAIGENLSLSVSGQYNNTSTELRDLLGTALNGEHEFDRINPSLGITYRMLPNLQVYAGYGRSNRAPSPVELTCADPDDPCRLPNAFLADPPLKQVVTGTVEAGLRGNLGDTSWQIGYFNARNENDIIFVSAGRATNQGYFDNVGDTDRRGLELSFDGALGDGGSWFFNYTYLSAEFGENFTVPSPNHPLADQGTIEVRAGDRLPGVPNVIAKTGVQYQISPRMSVGGDAIYRSNQVLRGDEGNLLPTIPGSVAFNLRGEFSVNDFTTLFLILDNVFDNDYETFGLLGNTEDVLGDSFRDNRFVSPAAPRAAWIGIRIGTNRAHRDAAN